MSTINCVSFRGHGSETTGSIAHRNNPTCPNCGTECPTCGNKINFKDLVLWKKVLTII